ncbi:MAG: DNA helicase UvrBC, partial [Spirochaetales bacterium]
NEREAILFVQQVSVSGKKEIYLCGECAKQRGIDVAGVKAGASLENFIKSVSPSQKLCYVCGRSLADIQKTSLLGCPECYVAFNAEIKNMLAQKKLDLPYTGSMPKRLAHFRSVLTDRMAIQKKLEVSVEHEEYEKAAMYRDFLKTLEHSAVNNGNIEFGGLFDE